MADRMTDKETRFVAVTASYKEVIAKVCYIYVSPYASFDDLYQEVLINIWQGLDSFRGEAKLSTWIYRTAINTCITWHRRNQKYASSTSLENLVAEPIVDSSGSQKIEQWQLLQQLISHLGPIEKAIITMWLDERSYDEIASVTGLSSGNIAVRIHRIKQKLSEMAAKSHQTEI